MGGNDHGKSLMDKIGLKLMLKNATDYAACSITAREFMFEKVYYKLAQRDDQAFMVIEKLYKYFNQNPMQMPDEYKKLLKNWSASVVVCDYIAGMTDNFCINLFNELFMPITR